MEVGVRIESESSAVKEWGPNHWIVREFPKCVNILSSKHSARNIERLLGGKKIVQTSKLIITLTEFK